MRLSYLILPFCAPLIIISSCLSGPPTYVPSNRSTLSASSVTPTPQAETINHVRVTDDLIIRYDGYEVSFDENHLIPRWVAYSLTADEVINASPPVKASFHQDPNLKSRQADNLDYKGSGWSRGHMAPAADFKWSAKAYEGTFVYTNCCPQNASLNNGSWNVLENKIRKWAKEYNSIAIVTGPIVGRNIFGTIGNNHVTIPDSFFKAVLIQHNGEYSCVGFVMTNTDEKRSLLDSFVSINRLEEMTGFDFFPQLDDDVEDVIEAIVDRTIWHF